MVEIFIGILFVFACVNLRSPRPISSIELKTPKDEQHPVSSTPLKRRHSHEEKSVCLSDHHIQEIKISKRRRSLDRKLFQNLPIIHFIDIIRHRVFVKLEEIMYSPLPTSMYGSML